MAEIAAVGFIGLGDQGAPIAEAIRAAGFPLHVWARRPEAASAIVERGAIFAPSAAAAAAADILCLCIVSDEDVEEVLLQQGALAALRPGAVLVIHSTVAPATVARIAEAAASRGVAVLDAPVSGGAQRAAAHSLLVMVGGAKETLERARPVLQSFSDHIVHLGDLGAGQKAKLVNNLLYTANLRMGLSALQMGAGAALDAAGLRDVLRHSTGRSRALAAWIDGTIDARRALVILRKDVELARTLVAPHDRPPAWLLDSATSVLDELEREWTRT